MAKETDHEQAVRLRKWYKGFADALPDNVVNYCGQYYSNIEIDLCNTDVECGYGVRISGGVKVMRPYNRCTNCGYHSLWNPDDSESKCLRHTYVKGWDTVFSWSIESDMELEKAFDCFLAMQPKDPHGRVVAAKFTGR